MRSTLRVCQLVALLAATGPTQAEATFFPILYTQQVDNNDNIVLMLPDGEQRQITDHRRKDSSPLMSPDGKFLLFTSERIGWWKIWKMNLADESFTQLTDSSAAEYAPCWSPAGDQIAFVSTRDGNAEIYVMDSAGSNLRNISNTQADDATPYWHRDDRIYYSTEVKGIHQIISVASDGSDRKVHTSGPGDKLMPQVSSSTDALLYYTEIDGNTDIYSLSRADSKLTRLTSDPLLDLRARWSPDGKQIIFERGDKRRNQHIYIMNDTGGNVRKLTTDGYNYAASFVANCDELCTLN